MRKISIRSRIFLLFFGGMLLVMMVMFILVRLISASVMNQTLSEYLMSAVDSNSEMLTYMTLEEGEEAQVHDIDDLFISYGDGYLRIDGNFLDVLNDVESAIFDSGGSLIYGNNQIAKELDSHIIRESKIYEKEISGHRYIVYDRKLTSSGLEDLWIRGTVPMTQQEKQTLQIVRSTSAFIPLLLVIIVFASAMATKSILRPVIRMEQTAQKIMGGDDLDKRIELPKNKDEMYNLAASYNEMLNRLQDSFVRERQFISDASHELRTPLSVILAQTEYIGTKECSNADYRAALDTVDRQAKRMKKLVEDMLDLSRIAQGKKKYPVEEVDLSGIVRNVSRDMSYIGLKGISVDIDVEDGISIEGNRDLLERMIVNLIDNAYKYGKDNGHTSVSLKKEGDKAVLSVLDDGIGISKSGQAKVFDRFYREDSSRSGVKGYGLGLSLVKDITAYHNGELGLSSEPGIGSNFFAKFPIL